MLERVWQGQPGQRQLPPLVAAQPRVCSRESSQVMSATDVELCVYTEEPSADLRRRHPPGTQRCSSCSYAWQVPPAAVKEVIVLFCCALKGLEEDYQMDATSAWRKHSDTILNACMAQRHSSITCATLECIRKKVRHGVQPAWAFQVCSQTWHATAGWTINTTAMIAFKWFAHSCCMQTGTTPMLSEVSHHTYHLHVHLEYGRIPCRLLLCMQLTADSCTCAPCCACCASETGQSESCCYRVCCHTDIAHDSIALQN
jgi:hypothetical protein